MGGNQPRGHALTLFVRAGCLICVLVLAAACGGGGGAGTPPPSSAPTNLTYQLNPCFYRAGEAIAANAATTGGGVPTQWQVSPALPTGLVFSTVDGAITGTPGSVATTASYTVTASTTQGRPRQRSP